MVTILLRDQAHDLDITERTAIYIEGCPDGIYTLANPHAHDVTVNNLPCGYGIFIVLAISAGKTYIYTGLSLPHIIERYHGGMEISEDRLPGLMQKGFISDWDAVRLRDMHGLITNDDWEWE